MEIGSNTAVLSCRNPGFLLTVEFLCTVTRNQYEGKATDLGYLMMASKRESPVLVYLFVNVCALSCQSVEGIFEKCRLMPDQNQGIPFLLRYQSIQYISHTKWQMNSRERAYHAVPCSL